MDFADKNLVFILTHGERGDKVAPWMKPVYSVPFDPALTGLGHLQAKASAHLISQLVPDRSSVHLASSPFLRCLETAQALSSALETELHVEESFGAVMLATDFDSDPFDMLAYKTEVFPNLSFSVNSPICRPQYPETYKDLQHRAKHAFEAYIEKFPVRTLVVVTHNFVLEALTSQLAGRQVYLTADGYCKLSIFTRSEEGYKMLVEADNSHAPQYIRSH